MSGWNHRVIKYTLPDGERLFAVQEVYYDDTGKPNAYADTPTGVDAESLSSLRWYIDALAAALKQPVLTPADFGMTNEQALELHKEKQ